MPLDTSVFSKLQTFDDYRRADEEFQLKKQLQAAQVMELQRKGAEIDADKLGEQAFLKAAQGMPLSPQETAALKYIDAKSPTSAFNPVTGNMEVKPSLLDRAGLGVPQPPVTRSASPVGVGARPVVLTGSNGQPVNEPSEWDVAFQNEMANAAGNPRLQQSIREAYSKKKLDMNAEESKAATYADRFNLSEPVLSDPAKIAAYADPMQRTKAALTPFSGTFGNYLNSDDYNSFEQAQKNFETAKLRQESGATINPSEFATDEKTLLPRASDSPEIIAQKKANREAVGNGLARQAGPAYKPTIIKSTDKALKPGDTKTSPTGIYMFNGGDPSDKSNWKKVK